MTLGKDLLLTNLRVGDWPLECCSWATILKIYSKLKWSCLEPKGFPLGRTHLYIRSRKIKWCIYTHKIIRTNIYIPGLLRSWFIVQFEGLILWVCASLFVFFSFIKFTKDMISTNEVKKEGKYIPGLYVQQNVVELWTGAVQEKLKCWKNMSSWTFDGHSWNDRNPLMFWFIFPSAFSSRLMS